MQRGVSACVGVGERLMCPQFDFDCFKGLTASTPPFYPRPE